MLERFITRTFSSENPFIRTGLSCCQSRNTLRELILRKTVLLPRVRKHTPDRDGQLS